MGSSFWSVLDVWRPQAWDRDILAAQKVRKVESFSCQQKSLLSRWVLMVVWTPEGKRDIKEISCSSKNAPSLSLSHFCIKTTYLFSSTVICLRKIHTANDKKASGIHCISHPCQTVLYQKLMPLESKNWDPESRVQIDDNLCSSSSRWRPTTVPEKMVTHSIWRNRAAMMAILLVPDTDGVSPDRDVRPH